MAAKRSTKKASASKKPPEAAQPEPEKRETCFVIMPFGGYFDRYYETIYKPAIKGAGLDHRRADDLFRSSAIVGDIWDLTREAAVILADMTDKNPNVFYELGLAHAIGKPVVLVAATMEDVPFDLRALRVLEYDRNMPDWGTLLRDKVESSIKEVLANPPAAVPSVFLKVKDSGPETTVTEHEKELIEIRQEFRQELEALRREVEGGRVLPERAPKPSFGGLSHARALEVAKDILRNKNDTTYSLKEISRILRINITESLKLLREARLELAREEQSAGLEPPNEYDPGDPDNAAM